jgi:hypothetical protein
MFTAVWGEAHIEQFKRGTLKTLSWEKNKSALAGQTWDIWSFEEHLDELERLIFNSFDVSVNLHQLPPLKGADGKPAPAQYLLHQPILKEMEDCLNTSSKLLMLPPDTLFGEGTIPNLLKLGEAPGTCVAVPHLRVLPHIAHSIGDAPIANNKLCSLAFEALHKSWVDAERGAESTNSFWSGVFWTRFDEKTVVVTHRIPTVYLAGFNGQDHAFWQMQNSFGSWDHRWPGECLIRQERQRVPGSSDIAMICEITDPGLNVPPRVDPAIIAQQGVDGFWTDTLHAGHNRQFQMVFKGE